MEQDQIKIHNFFKSQHMKKLTSSIILIACFACNQPAQKQETPKNEKMMVEDSAKAHLKKLSFDVKKDLVCGMPVSAGVEDTLSYKGKLYGFCSKECKDEFVKDPNQFLTAK